MKRIKLTPIDGDFDNYEDGYEDDIVPEEGPRFEFDLTAYIITCAIACGILFVVRFVEKHILHMR